MRVARVIQSAETNFAYRTQNLSPYAYEVKTHGRTHRYFLRAHAADEGTGGALEDVVILSCSEQK